MSNTQQAGAVVVHGGAGAPLDHEDGCVLAARRALAQLQANGDALDAAIAAVTAMEDDGRFNAGSGSALCLDGATIEMDASIMDTRGRLGAVACVRDVKNPVLLARAIADTPHVLLAGEGAERFARSLGMARSAPVSEHQRAQHRQIMSELAGSVPLMPGIDNRLFERFWNYKTPIQLPKSAACDTVGAVVRGPDGHFAVACSTGGSAPSLLGRVGDSPIIGSGFFAGPHGAVAASGIGEHIMRHLLARTVYGWIEDGMPLQKALERGLDLFDKEVNVGLIAVSRQEAGALCHHGMPQAKMTQR
ncbi:isoaspartyl peptidase/L-asparaginase [Massilia yuzhufengensis]|uniref:L-asparaginase/beta-aspartyl-peptidase (Threonine type) n=1 Tax=Massilia yuzhufengensis TaxID=1164594 RepID=A0A1I1M5Q3_9BURK|nr:isoaspartyl peptidase/L-asparaginase [Massilia yuzhufengensis]SFC80555.1 L-asparaginase/beta-aspartyl-peptidase (threonine type) [Massilia yuzhufengensis]